MKQLSVIVTGASTGLGKAIARLFLDKGHRVVINSVNETNLRQAATELGHSERLTAIAGNIGERAVGQQLVEAAVQQYGRLDVLVNNAGVFSAKPFLDVEEEDLDRFLDINLKGTFFTSQAAIRAMLNNGGGAIINIGTVLVDHAIAGFPSTAPIASKGAVHALTRQLAAEFGNRNIRVNTIAPGIIRSPLQEKNGITDPNSLAGLHLLNRIGDPVNIAETAYLLATNDFISGTTINVDGGHVAGHTLA
ncbi:MAG TPA: SDR family oxidoreductase [Chitinophaga sp.]|uniref:SDR family NAD(P)-dependent oxidoreductase n=1 Tax=Chitinophaga sp. TaxID=1869181 RepID=UPI002CF6A90F|nr:SDR family oxidoreductase [Chitinophaga sp.]HVI48752.1 SDR family oxidoreductase [Chitinophaga sp.]